MLATLLAGAAVALGSGSVPGRVAAGMLTTVVWMAGAGVVTGRHPRRLSWVVALAAATLSLFILQPHDGSTWSPHGLHVAAGLAYAAVAVAAALMVVRVVSEGKALLVTFSA